MRDAIREQQRRLATAALRLGEAQVDGIHDSRVAARRLRSMLKTFRPWLDVDPARRYRAELRRFAGALGEVREADVRRELFGALVLEGLRLPPAQLRRLGALLEATAAGARDELRQRLAEPEWAALLASLEQRRSGAPLVVGRAASQALVLERVARAWRRPVRILRGKPSTAAELHELRLAFKHCRYALEPVADVAPRETARLLRRLRAAQDRIGDHRDTELAVVWVQEHAGALGSTLTARLGAALDARERELRREAARRAARVLDAWEAWRTATRPLRAGGS